MKLPNLLVVFAKQHQHGSVHSGYYSPLKNFKIKNNDWYRKIKKWYQKVKNFVL